VHKIANVLDALPKRLQPTAKKLLHEMMEAPTRADARTALERFREQFDAKYPKAVAKLDKDWPHLTAFYDFPAEHWRQLRTSNAIESSFATVKLRTRVTKGAGSKKAALAMACKLLAAAQQRWRRFNGHKLAADVLAGTKFKDGERVIEKRRNDHRREGRRLITSRADPQHLTIAPLKPRGAASSRTRGWIPATRSLRSARSDTAHSQAHVASMRTTPVGLAVATPRDGPINAAGL